MIMLVLGCDISNGLKTPLPGKDVRARPKAQPPPAEPSSLLANSAQVIAFVKNLRIKLSYSYLRNHVFKNVMRIWEKVKRRKTR